MPKKIRILDDMLAALQTIVIANGYRTEIETVEHGIRLWDEVPLNQRPYIGIAHLTSRYSNDINGVYDVEMVVKIAACVRAAAGRPNVVALDALEDDIVGALHLDVTRGQDPTNPALRNADSTIVKMNETDEADPKRRQHGTMLLEAVVKYQRRRGVTP